MRNFLTENNKSPIADFHAIVTDHPRMRALGLGVFTTGDLNTWLNNLKQPHPAAASPMPEEFYGNWAAISHTAIDTLLGTQQSSDPNWGSFEAWRRHGATGKYEHQKWNDWQWSRMGDDINFSDSDLLFNSFWSQSDGKLFTHLKPRGSGIQDGWDTKHHTPASFGRNFFGGVSSPILQIIEMNLYMNQIRRVFPRTEWSDSNHSDLTDAKLFAMDNFLTDIKASKNGCIAFSGEVPFNINIADGGITCEKKDWVKYKLYLYDDSKTRNTDKVAVLRDPKIGGYKKDTLGRPYRVTIDGEVVDADTSSPGDQSVGDLERSWNPYTMKWESGTQNVFAKVVTHINAAVNNPSIESLEDSDIKADLDGDEDRHFAPSSGLVMPIEIQNANPMQWQPNYARTSGCRDQEKEKATLVGFNYNPLKSYPRDTLVMLSKIGGVWHITDMGSGISPEDKPIEAIFEGKWQFQYLATNSNSFFTRYLDAAAPEAKTRTDPEAAERAFHIDYYWDDALNGGVDPHSETNDYTDLEQGLVGGEPVILWTKRGMGGFYATRGWWQFTSFDFMDSLIGGTHDANYIASTNCQVDSAGRATEAPPNRARNGGSTGGFFGCVFPDGYRLNSTSTFFGGVNRGFVIAPRTAYHQNVTAEAVSYSAGLFDTSDLYANPSGQPFIDPASNYRVLDASGKWDGNYTPLRSRQRRMIGIDPAKEIDFENFEETFESVSSHHAPSMFFGETHDSRRDLKQLPADIGTLSSPSGKHGCPIQNIHALDILHGDMHGSGLREAVPNIFKERYWLRRADLPGVGGDQAKYKDDLSSAYGFQPKTTSRIMFRPLKVGTYTQFFPNLKASYHNKPRTSNPPDFTRGAWSSEAVRQYHFDASVTDPTTASPRSQTRELAQLGMEMARAGAVPPKVAGKNLLYSTKKGLLLRGDIHAESDSPGNINSDTGLSSHFHYPSYNSRVHDKNFWSNETFQRDGADGSDGLRNENKGANAFGVIGAVATTSANNQISFSTQNRIGMMCESRRTTGSSYLNPAWGGASTSYDSNRTTELWATVYQAHPRSQTIYDPRYFAVHHFNPFVYTGEKDMSVLEYLVEFQQRVGENIVDVTNYIDSRKVMTDAGGAPVQDAAGFFTIDRKNRTLEYDLIEPTRFAPDGAAAITCAVGEKIFKDTVMDSGMNPLSSLHQQSNWNINPVRLGKLLPFRYEIRVLGVPWPLGTTVDITDGSGPIVYSESLPADDPGLVPPSVALTAGDLVDHMIIMDRGENYDPGDIVGNEGMDVRFSVVSVEDYAEGGETIIKGIKELKLYSEGDIEVTSCSDSNRKILPNKVSGYTLKNIAAGGSGFSAFFVNAAVVLETRIDHKPKVVGDSRAIRLSAAPDGGGTQSTTNTRNDPMLLFNLSFLGIQTGGGSVTTNMVGGDYGIVYNGVESAVTITPEQRSSDRRYDVFFHFHNDITHTWMDPEYGDVFNGNDVDEQHITTQITAF